MFSAGSTERPEAPSSGARPGRGPSLSWAVGAVIVAIGAYIGAAPLADNSFFTHLATGRYILDHGLPSGDIYSFTAPGHRWVVQSWLPSVLYGGVEHVAGLTGVRALTALVGGALAGIVWGLTRPARGLVVRFAIAVPVLVIAGTMWSARPLLLGLLFLGLVLLAAEERIPPLVLAPVFWLWVNSHGSFPLGLLALGCLALGSRLDGRSRPAELRPLGWAAVGTLLGAVNPLGPVLLKFPVELLTSHDILGNVVEWRSPSFSEVYSRAFLLLVLAAIAALVRRPSWRAAIPLAVFLALGLVAARNIPVASLVLLPGLARGAAGLGTLTGELRSRAVSVLAAVVVVLGVVVVVDRLSGPDLDLHGYPVDAVAWLADEGLLTPATRRIAPDTVGNYLELLLGEDASVFADDRVDMFPASLVRDELSLVNVEPSWSEVLERWDADVVLWERSAALTQVLSLDPAWRIGYADEHWVVFLRR